MRIFGLVLVGLAFMSSCGSRDCTAAGCRSGVSFETRGLQKAFPDADTVDVCFEERCRRYPAAGRRLASIGQKTQDSEGPVHVRVVIRDRQGSVIERFARNVSLTRIQPNGADCLPVCWHASFGLGTSGQVTRTG
jgi:hypothetical protein